MVDVSTWSETPASNTTVDGVSIAENCSPANLNNSDRSIMAGVKTFYVAFVAFVATAVTRTGVETLSGKTLTSPVLNAPAVNNATFTGTPVEQVFPIPDAAAFEIGPANGSIQTITLLASRTPKGTTWSNGQSVLLGIDDGTAFTLTWTDTTFGASGVKWTGGAAPTLATTGYTWVTLWKVAGQVYGSLAGATG